jgi:YYY domain-containing protein
MEYGLVLVWLAAFAGIGLAGLPLAAKLFPYAAGRGAGFALPIGLATLGIVGYWVGHLAYGLPALVAGLVVLVGVSAALALDRDALRERRVEVRADIDIDRRAVREVAAVFTVAFLFLVAVRAVDPAVHAVAGEKYLDFGLLQSLSRADALPPEDVWYAGEPVKYYYGGHLVASLLSMLTGTAPRFAYNLALAGAYATLVAAAYDLAAAVAADRGLARRGAGVTAAFFVGVAANLSTTVRLVFGWLPLGVAREIAVTVGIPLEQMTVTPAGFSYWDASRVIPGTVNEFPLFGFLNGDLHAHMTGTPFFLLGVALAAAYYRTPANDRRRRLALVFGAIPLVASFGAVANTWSYPSYFGVLWLAATFAPAGPLSLLPPARAAQVRDRVAELVGETVGEELLRPLGALAVAAGAGVVATVLAAPFLLGAGASGSERSVALLAAADRSSVGGLVLVHGAFLVPFGIYLVDRLTIHRVGAVVVGLAAVGVVASVAALPVALLTVPLLVAGWAALRLRSSVGFEVVLLLAGLGLVTAVEVIYLNEQAGPGRFNTVFKTYAQVWLLFATGAGVALPALARRAPTEPETTGATMRAPSRQPAVADGAGATDDDGPERDDEDESEGPTDLETGTVSGATDPTASSAGQTENRRSGALGGTSTRRQVATVALVAILVVATSSYGVLAVGNHFGRAGEPTLDALAFAERTHPDEAAAIAWLDDRTGDRQPTLASAPATSFYPGRGGGFAPGMYDWSSSPAASLTGVPTVAGWGHEVGYRGSEAYYGRVADVDTIYTGTADSQAALLAEYDVRYVWVGSGERARYGMGAITIDDRQFVDLVHRSGDVRVYAVRTDRLPG